MSTGSLGLGCLAVETVQATGAAVPEAWMVTPGVSPSSDARAASTAFRGRAR
jgi:hypothetical protein